MSGWAAPPKVTYAPASHLEVGRIGTSRTELIHAGVAFAILTFDFAVINSGFNVGFLSGQINSAALLHAIPFALAATLTGFFFHELAHKVSAQRLGFWSEFRASSLGLLISVVTAFIGFLFAAPGATLIAGASNRRDWGRSALAGPAVNLVEAVAFLTSGILIAFLGGPPTVAGDLILLAFFNGWFATFNLLPFGPLDGAKVMAWNMPLWLVVFGIAAALTGATYFLFVAAP